MKHDVTASPMKYVYPEWRGKASDLPFDVQYAMGVVLGAAAFHRSLEGLLIHVGTDLRRKIRNEQRRIRRAKTVEASRDR